MDPLSPWFSTSLDEHCRSGAPHYLPKKILKFLWCCLRGFFPVKERLLFRLIDIDEVCPLRRQEVETICHIFFYCVFARAIWCRSGLSVWVTVQSIHQWLQDIWLSRNAFIWNQHRPSDAAICTVVASLISDWKTAVAARQVVLPTEGTLKLNVDSICFKHDSGVLSWLKGEVTNSRINVEVDCLELVAAIRGKRNGSCLGGMVSNIKRLLDQFRSIAISHFKRSANQVAHMLASTSGSIPGSHCWGSIPPAFIFAVMTWISFNTSHYF
ncbi:hypothetical protein K2173_007013 [Erythroxylum novogranatense]|uniref:RNase H type-1 domain-containing protein n=1 Tax=Erythroxylum novogranatense TaxID=1862640 RepID=A0AAV8SL79_9ROSI|nr:hypothetical protein K2173_007013 [Erythroxylum novogranatense]